MRSMNLEDLKSWLGHLNLTNLYRFNTQLQLKVKVKISKHLFFALLESDFPLFSNMQFIYLFIYIFIYLFSFAYNYTNNNMYTTISVQPQSANVEKTLVIICGLNLIILSRVFKKIVEMKLSTS